MAAQPAQELIALDKPAEQGFLHYFASLPEKSDTTFRVFDRSEYYTVHGPDALFVAKEVFKSMNVIKYLGSGNKKLPSVALSKINFEATIRDLLLVRQYRVELYQNKGGKGAHQSWCLMGKASPGNLQQFEEVLFGKNEMSTSVGVVAFKLDLAQKIVGVAYVDVSDRIIQVCEITDNEHFSNIEALLVQLGPKECILQANDQSADAVKLREVVKRSGILITEKKKGNFSANDVSQDLNRLLKIKSGNSITLPEMDLHQAMSCVAVLIKYLELLSDETNFGQFTLSKLDLSQFMSLDAAAVRALNLMPSSLDGANKSGCLLGLLNKCKTAQGKRLLAQWIMQPLLDKNRIEERLNLVEAFFNDVVVRQICQEELKKYPDFSRVSKKFHKQKATLQDCVRVYQAIKRLSELVTGLDQYHEDHRPLVKEIFITPFQELVEDFSKFVELVETTIDLDRVDKHEFLIKPAFDEGLQECRECMDELLLKIPREMEKAARDLGLEAGKTIKLETNNQYGYYIRITRKEEKKLRGNKRYTTLETRKDGVKFITSSLRQLNEQFQSLKTTYDDVQSKLAEEVIKIASGYSEPMQILNDVLAKLDVLVSLAFVASCAPISYCRPTIHPKGHGSTVLAGVRHPCLEVQDEIAFIPNDISLDKHEQSFLIITGPNMGGKSTYIRSAGIAVLMAQIGCFVPCDTAEISITDAILARVGAADSQLKGVSTFMSEMLETASILRTATENSLIIIDELGRGTSTYDGFGLAWAISHYISTRIKAMCLFATHFHELTALADVVDTVKNYHVTAMTTEETLTLLYRVQPGVCDQSFGIHVAELTKFPKQVIEFAKRKSAELEDFQGQTAFNDDGEIENDDVSTAKRRRLDKKKGDEMIEEFLRKVSQIADDLNDEEAYNKVNQYKQLMISENNSFINVMLHRGAMVTD